MTGFRISRSGLELIKRLEGFRGRPVRLDNGRWMIGYGHVFLVRPNANLSTKEAELLLLYDLRTIAQTLGELIFTPLTQNQTDAVFSFAYNIGLEAFAGSKVVELINQGSLVAAAASMEHWCKADLRGHSMVIDGLVRRRAAEKALFLTPEGGWQPAPSHILIPTMREAVLVKAHSSDDRIDADHSDANKRNALAADSGIVQDLDSQWYPEFKHARAVPRHESVLSMVGVALLGLSAIAASAYQGLTVPPAPGNGSQTIFAWVCGLAGLLALAFVVRNLIHIFLPKLR